MNFQAEVEQIETNKDEKKIEGFLHDKTSIVLFVITIIGVIILISSIFTVGIYKFDWNSGFTKMMVAVIPYPAATVNGKLIRYSEYLDYVETLSRGGVIGDSPVLYQDVKGDVLDNLVRGELLRQIAVDYNVEVSNEEIDEKMAELQTVNGSLQEMKDRLLNELGWTLSDYESRVLVPIIRFEKLTELILGDDNIQKERKEYAEETLEKIHSGFDFATIANQVSQDPSALYGGDLGYLTPDDFPTDVAQQIFWIGEGETTEVLDLGDAYYIYRVSEIVDTGVAEQRHMWVIVIRKKTVNDIYEQYYYDAEIMKYI